MTLTMQGLVGSARSDGSLASRLNPAAGRILVCKEYPASAQINEIHTLILGNAITGIPAFS